MVLVMSNSILEDEMPDKWLEPENYKKNLRLNYIKSFQAHIPSKCPECETPLTVDDEEIYCPCCGLITQTSISFIAGVKYHLPHGLRLG